MICLHGLLGGRKYMRNIVSQEAVTNRRNSYIVKLRNHNESDFHPEMNYNVLSDDIIRFADKEGLEKFTLLGHGLGGRTAMTVACRYPERVDGLISLDAAPVNGSARRNEFGRR